MRWLILFAVALSAGCNAATPYTSTVGVLHPGAALKVAVESAALNVYAPEAAQPHDLFTVAATALPKGTPPPAPTVFSQSHGIVVRAPLPLANLLVRVPDRVNLVVDSRNGDVNVTDITGSARVVAQRGNVSLMVPGYAQATLGRGNLSVIMGATQWPGTLFFSTGHGDIEIRLNPNAPCSVHLHTDAGTLFTDFGLRGTSSGTAETIDGTIGAGGSQRIDVETRAGSIRLLRLQPQA